MDPHRIEHRRATSPVAGGLLWGQEVTKSQEAPLSASSPKPLAFRSNSMDGESRPPTSALLVVLLKK